MSNCKFNIGDAIEAKAIHVTSEAECARRYGSNSKTKFLNGIVTAIINHPTPSGRRNWYEAGTYDLGGGEFMRAKLHNRSVRAISSTVGGATTSAVGGATTAEVGVTTYYSSSNESQESSNEVPSTAVKQEERSLPDYRTDDGEDNNSFSGIEIVNDDEIENEEDRGGECLSEETHGIIEKYVHVYDEIENEKDRGGDECLDTTAAIGPRKRNKPDRFADQKVKEGKKKKRKNNMSEETHGNFERGAGTMREMILTKFVTMDRCKKATCRGTNCGRTAQFNPTTVWTKHIVFDCKGFSDSDKILLAKKSTVKEIVAWVQKKQQDQSESHRGSKYKDATQPEAKSNPVNATSDPVNATSERIRNRTTITTVDIGQHAEKLRVNHRILQIAATCVKQLVENELLKSDNTFEVDFSNKTDGSEVYIQFFYSNKEEYMAKFNHTLEESGLAVENITPTSLNLIKR